MLQFGIHAQLFKRNRTDMEETGSAGDVFPVNLIDIIIGTFSNSSPGFCNEFPARAEYQCISAVSAQTGMPPSLILS